MSRRKGFANWFGELDLNQPLDEDGSSFFQEPEAGTSAGPNSGNGFDQVPETSAGPSGGEVPDVTGRSSGPSTSQHAGLSDVQTGVTLSTDDSGNEGEAEVQSTPEGYVPRTPFVGMMFESRDAALMHYNRYAKHIGFSVKIESSRKSAKDGEQDKSVFVCNKKGKNEEDEQVPVKQRNRLITKKCECNAKLRVKRVGAKWQVTQFVEEHSHEVIQKFALKKYLRSHKKIPKEERKFIDLLHEVNLPAGRIMQIMGELYGGIKNVPYDSKAVSNYTQKIGEKERIKDIPSLLDYFEEIKLQDPMFYYKFKLDDESRVQNIFWVDGAAREVYKLYHDCISFDTTYMTNAYKMPCAPFIGINRYGQSIQLGCGFIRQERIEDFVWLFEVFLDAMDGLHPLNIITDQCGSMRSAILTLLPHTCHRNCRWHIMQKVQEKLGPITSKNAALRKDFNDVIDFSVTPEEFETKWAEMLVKHDIVDNANFLDVYDLREHFVPAYFRDRFFPFLQTTARSEGFNAVLKKYSHPNDSLLHFFKQFMKLQEQIDVNEDAHTFDGEDKIVRLWGDFPMEKQILETYTLPLYNRYQLEMKKITAYNCRDCGGGVFEIFPINVSVYGYGSRTYRVEADIENEVYNCQCCKFSRDGILCCHVMRVMSHIGKVKRIPDHYILKRWSIPAPDIVAPTAEPIPPPSTKLSRKDMRMLRYGNLCNDFAKRVVALAASEKTVEIANKHMAAMDREMAELKRATAEALKRKKKKGKATTSSAPPTDEEQEADLAAKEHEAILAQNRKARDPPMSNTKGRPQSKRKKSGLHLNKPNPTNCSVCNENDHDARNCPVRLANPEKYPLLSLFQ